jgi:hypothetical protein
VISHAREPRRLPRRVAVLLSGAALVVVLAGCSSGGSAPVAPLPPTTVAGPADADPDRVACARHAESGALVRRVVAEIEKGPVLPAGVAIILVGSRSGYGTPGSTDPSLTAALQEVGAAIDDLDRQGHAKLPPGGDVATSKVALDPTRTIAALDAADAACAGR